MHEMSNKGMHMHTTYITELLNFGKVSILYLEVVENL